MSSPLGTVHSGSFSVRSRLQVGVEIEFSAPPDIDYEEAHKHKLSYPHRNLLAGDACHHALAESLNRAGLPAAYEMRLVPSECPNNPLLDGASRGAVIFDRYRIFGNPHDFPSELRKAGMYRYWVIKSEFNISDDPRYDTWISCELNTPIIPEEVACDITREFTDMNKALTVMYETFAPDVPHITPAMSGLHVHLALEDGTTFDYFKRVLTLALILDQSLLFPLCDPDRQTQNRKFLTDAKLRNSDFLIPADMTPDAYGRAHLPDSLVAAQPRVLGAIWDARNFADLSNVTDHPRVLGNMLAPVKCKTFTTGVRGKVHGTIEFRHAQASFSASFVRNWVKLVLAIGRVALLETGEFRRAVAEIWTATGGSVEGLKPGHVVLETLQALSDAAKRAGMPKSLDVDYWRERMQAMKFDEHVDIDEEGRAILDRG